MAYRHESRKSLLAADASFQLENFQGGYLEREGLSTIVQPTSSVKRSMYRPDSTYTWLFVLVSIAQACVVIGLESYMFVAFHHATTQVANESSVRTIPTYLVLFIFGFIYQIFLVYDSLRLKNTIQVIGLCAFNYAMLIYAAVQVDQIKKAIDTLVPKYIEKQVSEDLWTQIYPFIVAVACIIAAACVALSWCALQLYREFAWHIYKHISADTRMRRRYLVFQIYIALLKFDFFFFLGFTVQFVVIVADTKDPEFWLTIGAIPVTIIILAAAGFFVRRENLAGMICVTFLYFGGLAYFIFKLIRMYQPGFMDVYVPVRKSLTVFAVLVIILILMTIANSIVCMRNFGKGLKPHVTRRKVETEEEKLAGMTEMPDLKSAAPNRMVID